MRRVTLVTGDDWEALYIDGELVEQNHSIDARVVMDAINGKEALWKIEVDYYDADPKQLEDGDGFPAKLTDVVVL